MAGLRELKRALASGGFARAAALASGAKPAAARTAISVLALPIPAGEMEAVLAAALSTVEPDTQAERLAILAGNLQALRDIPLDASFRRGYMLAKRVSGEMLYGLQERERGSALATAMLQVEAETEALVEAFQTTGDPRRAAIHPYDLHMGKAA